jgi:hypothetical protein
MSQAYTGRRMLSGKSAPTVEVLLVTHCLARGVQLYVARHGRVWWQSPGSDTCEEILIMTSKFAFASLLSLSVGLAIVTASKDSEAQTYVNCAVTNVYYKQNWLRISCADGNMYNAVDSNSNCPNSSYVKNSDTLKTWASLAQAALLSGKYLAIGYTTCVNSDRLVVEMILKNQL